MKVGDPRKSVVCRFERRFWDFCNNDGFCFRQFANSFGAEEAGDTKMTICGTYSVGKRGKDLSF